MMLPDTKARIRPLEQIGPPVPKKLPMKKPVRVAQRMPAPSLSLSTPMEESPLSLAAHDPLELRPQLQGRKFLSAPSSAGARPGDTKVSSLDLSQGMTSGKSRNSYMDAPGYEDLVQAALNTSPNRSLARGIDDQQAFYDATVRGAPRGQVDLTPLMAMADAMTGSHFASSYRAPDGFAENAKLLSGLQDKTQSSRERLAQLVMNETGGLKNGQDEQGYKSGLDESQKAGFSVPKPNAPRAGMPGAVKPIDIDRFYKTFQGTTVVKDGINGIQAAAAVKDALKNKNWLGDETAKAKILKAMQLFPVSDKDAARVTGSPDFLNRAQQAYGRLVNGTALTVNDRLTIEEYAKYAEKSARTRVDEAKNDYINGMGAQMGIPYDVADRLLQSQIPAPAPVEPERESLVQQLIRKKLENMK